MAASYRSTDWFPPPTGSVTGLNMLEMDMVERLNTDQRVLQDQDKISSRPASSRGFNTESFHIGGYDYAADTPRSYHSHTDVPSFEKVSPGMINEMFYHGNGVPSDFQRSSLSTRNQSSLQHYGDLYADDSRHFAPFDLSNQQYPTPEHMHLSPEFHMFQANSRHFDRHVNERNSSETDYMMRTRGNFGLRNNIYGEPRGMNLNPFSGENMFPPVASTRPCMKHLGSAELPANDFNMGPAHGVLHDAFESAASLSYREQAYTQCKKSPFSASSSIPTWENDYNLPPLDEARSGSYNDVCHCPDMLDMLTESNRGPRASRLNSKSKMITYDHVDRFCQQELLSQFRDAKFFVIKSYSEDNVHKSIKYCVWASTKNGNKKLDAAYREAKKKEVACPVFLLFSVNCLFFFITNQNLLETLNVETDNFLGRYLHLLVYSTMKLHCQAFVFLDKLASQQSISCYICVSILQSTEMILLMFYFYRFGLDLKLIIEEGLKNLISGKCQFTVLWSC
ncbi:YTH domain [Arabidopsis thaliana x Arabidopsis arenosa]|uniref:YTH domain-containing family protein n=1 Tax=Arabidopsis thaliana x Arabidopsis arenosa TaxID=1240361 RepID=A0A8T2C538_9BRAS|nr:YTH domain [Arabidopsis thaliana x Arabidopsis arenosa]